jgi:chromosome partitioning protein
MYDRRNRLTDLVEQDVREHLRHFVYEAVIPRNVRLSEAPSHGLPGLIYDPVCRGSRAYIALAGEVLGQITRPDGPRRQATT